MDKPKEDSPEKSKFANSLVAMYGSGSDTSEDDDSQQNAGKTSEPSLQDAITKDKETDKLQDTSEVFSDVVSNINEAPDKSLSEASKVKTDETILRVSDDATPQTTQDPPVEEDASKVNITRTVESDNDTFSDGIETSNTSDHPEEVTSTKCQETSFSVEESVKEPVGEDTQGETARPCEEITSKSDVIKLDNVLLVADSVEKTESSIIKEVGLSDNNKSDVNKSVQDIVAEIDDILAQGAPPSKITEIQVSKSENCVIETDVEVNKSDDHVMETDVVEVRKSEDHVIKTAVAGINLKDKMDIDSNAAIPIKGETDENPAVSEANLVKMSVDKDGSGEVHIEKMEVAEESVDARQNIDESLNAENGKKLDVAKEKIKEISSVAEGESLEAVEDEVQEDLEVAVPQSSEVSNETSAEKKVIPGMGISVEEIVPKLLSTEGEIPPEKSEGDKQVAIAIPKSSEESELDIDDSKEEKNSESTVKAENVKQPTEVLEAELITQEIPKSSLATTDVIVEDPKSSETAEVKKEIRTSQTEKGNSEVLGATNIAELEKTKPEPAAVPKEEILKIVCKKEGGQKTTDKEKVLLTVEEETTKAAEATEQASDSSFATCEELDKSDEIGKGEDEIKFDDATDELTTNENAVSPETGSGEAALANEESKVQLDEPAMKDSEVLDERQVLEKGQDFDAIVSAVEPASDPVVSAPEHSSDPDVLAQESGSNPVASAPEQRSEPASLKPEQDSDPVASAPELDSDPVALELEQGSDPVPSAPKQISDHVASSPEQGSDPVASAPDAGSDPVTSAPDPGSEPVAPAPEQVSEPVAPAPDQVSEPVAPAPHEVIRDVTARNSTEEGPAKSQPSPIPEKTQVDREQENTEVEEKMEVDEVDRVPSEVDVASSATEVILKPKEADAVIDETVVQADTSVKRDGVCIEPQVERSKDDEVSKKDETTTSSLDENLTSQKDDVSVEGAVPEGDIAQEDVKKAFVKEDANEDVVKDDIMKDVSTERTAAAAGKKEPTVRRLRQVRHPSAKAAEAAADATFVAAVTPTRTNLKEAKIACAIANVTETAEVIHKELPTPSRLRKTRSSSTEPQPAPEVEHVEPPTEKPVSIKLKIVKDAVEIVSSERPDSTVLPVEAKRQKKEPSDMPVPPVDAKRQKRELSDMPVPPVDAKRQKRELSDLPAAKEAHFMKNLEVQIPPSDVSIYETTMSPGGTSRKHKRHREGPASPSVTLSPITLKIAKDKSSENLCCIVPEEVRTASPIDSEGREKITLKISKDDKMVRASVSPLVSPAERSEEAKIEKAALKLAKEEAAALARNRDGVSSPRSDDGESRLERITLKLSVGEKNSWSIKSADSDSALSPSSTDSGSTKMKPKISVVRMEDLLEGEVPKSSKRQAQTAGNEGFVLQIAPDKQPPEETDEVPSKVMRLEEVAKPASVVSDDVEILEDKPEVAEEPVEHKPPIEEIILEDSSSAPPESTVAEKQPVQHPAPMDVDDDIVILSANIVKKARGRPRKVRPLVEAPGTATAPTPAAEAPPPETKPQTEELQDHRPKRVCKGRERLPPKPTKPRGRYAHLLKLRQAEEAAAAAAAAAGVDAGGVLPTSTAVTVTIVPPTSATSTAPTTATIPTPKPALTIIKIPKESPVKTKESPVKTKETPVKSPKESFAKAQKETPVKSPKESFAKAQKETPVKSPKESFAKAQKETPVKAPKEHPAKTPRGTALKAPHSKSKIIRPEAPQVFEEETRMSADISTCPTPTTTQSESPGASASAPATPAQPGAAQPEGRPGISFNSPLAAIDSTGILPRLVITPCPPVRPQTPVLSTTGDESQSNSTTELTRASGNKKGRMEVVDPDAKAEFTVDMIAEYMWPPIDRPGVRGEIFMIQEQISLYLGVKSFKRKYPYLLRRPVEHEERQYLLDRKLVSEKLCDLGLTAVVNHEVLDVMVVDFPEKYEEYRKFSSEKAQRQLSSKQKAISSGRIEDSTSVSQRDAASFNSMLNRERREQRKCFFDLQAFSIQYPESRRKRMTPANLSKVGNYPVALVPGQYTDYYKKYTAAELRYFPLNTVLYGPLMPGEIRDLHMIAGSEGSQTDSSDSSSSDSDSSNSGSSGSSDSYSSSDDSDDEMSSQVDKTESHDSIPDKDVSPCKVCQGDRQKNKQGVPEPLIICAVCSSSGHPTCLDLTVDMVPHIRKYNWQCTDCKTCAQCKDPADEDKMLFCDMCDRGYHIYCVGLRKVPEGRWHCTECAMCSSCGSRDPGGLPDQQKTEPVIPNNTPNKSDLPQWQHEFKKGDKGTRIYVRTLCVPCSRLWKKGRYCRLCWKCYGNKPEEEGLINCSACDRWMHSDCCRSAGSVIDDKTSNFLCELCQQRGVRSPTKNFKTPVR